MRWLPGALTLLGLLLLQTTVRASDLPAPQLVQAVEQCIETQFQAGEATSRSQSVNLQQTCPALALANARNHALLKHIQPPLADEITVSQLLDIRVILHSRTRSASPGHNRDYAYANLDALLQDTYIPREEFKPDPTLWQRFIEWLRDLLTPEDAEPPPWLKDFLNSIELPETDTVILFLKGALALLVLLALLMIFNELRAANLLSAWRHIKRQRGKLTGYPDFPGHGENLSLEQISGLPDKQFAGKLLRHTLLELMQRHILPPRFSLTNRELLTRLPQERNALLPDLHRLIDTSEAGLYGDQPLDPQQRQQMLELSSKLTRIEEAT